MSISSTSSSSNSVSGPDRVVPSGGQRPGGDPGTGAPNPGTGSPDPSTGSPKPSGAPRGSLPTGSRPSSGGGFPSLPKLGGFNLESLKDKVDLQALKEEAESKFQEMMGDGGAGAQKMLAGLMSNFGG